MSFPITLIRLYTECGWESLAERRSKQKLKFMYKAVNGMVPSYITDLIPPIVGNVSRYELRNSDNISRIPTKTTTFSNSCIPSAINNWNNLQAPLRQCESFSSFCYTLKNQSVNKVPNYFNYGKRKVSIIHARLRNFCSDLNQDLYVNHLRDSPICSCLKGAETAEHFFFQCEHYTQQRIRLFRETQEFHPLNANMLLKGKNTLTENHNIRLFQSVQTYIHSTGRFNN